MTDSRDLLQPPVMSGASGDSNFTPPHAVKTSFSGDLHAVATHPQRRLFAIIFRHDTRPGRWFDVGLLIAIVASTGAVMLESVPGIRERHGTLLYAIEWGFTILFTIEYALRLYCVRERLRYMTSFFGVVDLLAVLPTYLSLFLPGAQALSTVRALRLLRIFRVLKLVQFVGEAAALKEVLWISRAKIVVFLLVVTVVVTIVGALMHVIEGPHNSDFASIPQSIYWAIVTMATVGYGDIVPVTPMGKFLSAVLIVFGYSLIVVPTGIVTAEWQEQRGKVLPDGKAGPTCPQCGLEDLDSDSRYCKRCGARIDDGSGTQSSRNVVAEGDE